jgi:dihydroxyacetone kinase-like predicted kinase
VTVTVGAAQSTTKDITAFAFLAALNSGLAADVDGKINGTNIAVTVPFGTAVTALVPAIVSTGASISPASGVAQDFTSPVIYTVTAGDGTTKPYTVTVTVAANSAKAITAFSFTKALNSGLAADVAGVINGTNIAVTLPTGTVVTGLIATFTTTGASVKVGTTAQVSGTTPNDFTAPVSYTVTAADATTAVYTVTVTVP